MTRTNLGKKYADAVYCDEHNTSSHAYFSQVLSVFVAFLICERISHVHTCGSSHDSRETETISFAPENHLTCTPCLVDHSWTSQTSLPSVRHHLPPHSCSIDADQNRNNPLCHSATERTVWLSGQLLSKHKNC